MSHLSQVSVVPRSFAVDPEGVHASSVSKSITWRHHIFMSGCRRHFITTKTFVERKKLEFFLPDL